MPDRAVIRLLTLASAAGFAAALGAAPAGKTSSEPAAPRSNLEYWLGQAGTTSAPAAVQPPATNPFGGGDRFSRSDALPGVLVLSDGRMIAGGVYTTRDKSWQVWVKSQKRWRHIPPILVLSIRAVVVAEGLEKEWRWKEMGSDEKVYTGRTKPVRRFLWRFHLIDDSTITGAVKGQPLWVETPRRRHGPFVLHERSDGKYGQKLEDLIYVKTVIISRRAMEKVLKSAGPASKPAD